MITHFYHQATDEEISNAYRRLSRHYHPDKHSDPEKKTKAEMLFNKTKGIYEVLHDAHKRAIYDTLGVKGLQMDGWELVERGKTPSQIREEFERLAWLEEERKLQQQTNPRGAIVININATDMFAAYPYDFYSDESEADEGFLPNIEVSGMSFSQAIEAPLTTKNTAILSGQLTTNNGTGSGSINCAVRRLTSSRGWTEFDVGVGNGLSCAAKGFRTLSKRSYATLTGDVMFTHRGISPGVNLSESYILFLSRLIDCYVASCQ
jgi:DnaJ family protein C protein 11